MSETSRTELLDALDILISTGVIQRGESVEKYFSTSFDYMYKYLTENTRGSSLSVRPLQQQFQIKK